MILRVLLHPGVIEGGMVGNELKHQPEPAPPQTLAESAQRSVAEVRMHGVAGDRESGAPDIILNTP
jgi:hypothetical protein